MPEAVVQRYYNLLTVSLPDEQPLPAALQGIFEHHMQYTLTTHLRGRDREWYDPITGVKKFRNVVAEERRLFRLDGLGRFVCPSGYESYVFDVLERQGYKVTYVNRTPPVKGRHANAFEPNWHNLLKYMKLRVRQDEALIALASNDGGLFEAPPGFGKSFLMGAAGLLFPKARILAVLRGTVLVEKTVAELTGWLPNVGLITGSSSKCRFGCRVTVCSADSLHKVPDDSVDIALIDEVHLLLAEKYQEAFSNVLRSARIYGLTATPEGRGDGTDARMEAVIGPTIFKMTQQEAEELGLVVPIEVRWMNVHMDKNPGEGKRDTQHKRAAIWKNPVRNQLIADCANRHADDQVLIIVETTTHAFELKKYLPDFELCYGNIAPDRLMQMLKTQDIPDDVVPMNASDREKLRKAFNDGTVKKVIATDVWSTGVSFNSLAVMIRADGRASKIMDTQIPGRATRIDPKTGKQIGIVYDFLDQFDDSCKRHAATRKKNYGERGWNQVTQARHWPETEAQTTGRRHGQRQLF